MQEMGELYGKGVLFLLLLLFFCICAIHSNTEI